MERVTAQIDYQAGLAKALLALLLHPDAKRGGLSQEQKVQDLDKCPDTALQRCMYLTELDRVKFALRSYYRTRLRKVWLPK